MRQFEDTTHIRVEENNVNNDRVLSQEESGFNIALGFIENSSYKPQPVEIYGLVEISVISNEWREVYNEDGELDFDIQFKDLALRPCS